jgi:hypothetical protein
MTKVDIVVSSNKIILSIMDEFDKYPENKTLPQTFPDFRGMEGDMVNTYPYPLNRGNLVSWGV